MFVLVVLTIVSAPAEGTRCYPSPFACPVTQIVKPTKVMASHDGAILLELTSGAHGLDWNVPAEGERVVFNFSGNVVLRRLQLQLTRKGERIPIHVPFEWRANLLFWPLGPDAICGTLVVEPDSGEQCFILNRCAKIPANVPAGKFTLSFPAGISVQRIAFSESPTEHVMHECPMPDLGDRIEIAYSDCVKHPGDSKKERVFVDLLKKAMCKYDCLRPGDSEPVPAWWLCDDEHAWRWLTLLSKLPSRPAKDLFGSKLFRDTLDGYIAGSFFEESLRIQDELNKSATKGSDMALPTTPE